MNNYKKTKIEENIEPLTNLIINCFQKSEQLKKHKISYLNKIANIAINVHKFLNENSDSAKVIYFNSNSNKIIIFRNLRLKNSDQIL